MTTKPMSATLLAAAAALGLATGTAFADNHRVPATGYVYPNHWPASAEQPSGPTAAHQGDDTSVGAYGTEQSTGTHLFPPNPNW